MARFATLDLQGFWLDEAATVEVLRLDLSGLIHRIPEAESTPPLYYLLAWLWSKPFGLGEVGLRSLSALLGTAFVPVAYAAAARLCSRRVGLAVAAMAAVNPLLVWYSQEARAYALLALLVALSLWAFARVLDDERGWAHTLWAVASALALATHYFAAFLVLPMAAWLATSPDHRHRARPAVAAVAATAVALLPLALHQRSLGLASFIAAEPLEHRAARAGKNFLVGFDTPLETAVAVVAVLIAAAGTVAAFTALTDGRERSGARLAGALGLVAVAIPFALAAVGVDYLDTRNLLGAWLPLAIVPAAGLVAAGRAGLAGVAVLCAIGVASLVGVAVTPAWQRDDWRGMATALGEPDGTRAILVQPASGRRPLALYMPGLRSLPAENARVTEIAVLYPVQRDAGGVHPKPPPRTLPPGVPGFEPPVRRLTESYAVVTMRALESDGPLSLAQANALGLRRDQPSAALLQEP